jgi:hypothetical protein
MGRRPVATGYVDLGTTGRTELRIHGVGGTSPSDLLDHPHPVQVAGDATSGFFRRWDADGQAVLAQPGDRHVEAFCWGGLTSGSTRRALWVLLIPFLLVNVAHWALPGRAARRPWANTGAQRLLRLLALSLTVTLMLAAGEVGTDLLGRQCAATSCIKSAPSWLKVLAAHPAALLALGALLPLATLGLIGWLGRSTWKTTEVVGAAGVEPVLADPDGPALSDPLFWIGSEPVRRLWALHVSAGLSIVAVLQVAPSLDGPKRGLAVAVAAVATAVLAAAVVLVIGDGVARPHHRRPLLSDVAQRAPWLIWPAAAAMAGAIIVDLLPHAVTPAVGAHELRRLDGIVQTLFAAQTATVVLLIVFALLSGLRADASLTGRRSPADLFVPGVLAILGWLTAWFFSAGITVRVALQLFGTARGSVPPTYLVFAAVIVPAGGLILTGLAVALICLYRAARAEQLRTVSTLPPPAGPSAGEARTFTAGRSASLATARARASLLDVAMPLAAVATVACVVFAVAAIGLALDAHRVLSRYWVQRLADLGTLLLGLGILRLLALSRTAWQQASARKTLGILWDLGTFWPRAAHPLAPPCYCERALPQLRRRLAFVGGQPGDHVVVAGHSQGSVIAAALLLMPREDLAAQVTLLTYGCPLGRLYARAFPGYLGPQVLGVDPAPATTSSLRTRAGRWLNLYRATDPIGGWIQQPHPGQPRPSFGTNGAVYTSDIDVLLVDPDFGIPPGDLFPPGAAAHSHYREDPTYAAGIAELLE